MNLVQDQAPSTDEVGNSFEVSSIPDHAMSSAFFLILGERDTTYFQKLNTQGSCADVI